MVVVVLRVTMRAAAPAKEAGAVFKANGLALDMGGDCTGAWLSVA
jgi:hypothetical protein